jgi:hypothetical protein
MVDDQHFTNISLLIKYFFRNYIQTSVHALFKWIGLQAIWIHRINSLTCLAFSKLKASIKHFSSESALPFILDIGHSERLTFRGGKCGNNFMFYHRANAPTDQRRAFSFSVVKSGGRWLPTHTPTDVLHDLLSLDRRTKGKASKAAGFSSASHLNLSVECTNVTVKWLPFVISFRDVPRSDFALTHLPRVLSVPAYKCTWIAPLQLLHAPQI